MRGTGLEVVAVVDLSPAACSYASDRPSRRAQPLPPMATALAPGIDVQLRLLGATQLVEAYATAHKEPPRLSVQHHASCS